MSDPRTFSIPRFIDARGSLIATEFPDLPFEPKRVFIVTGPPGGSQRGCHVVPCEELFMLLAGTARVAIAARKSSPPEELRLSVPGECVRLRPGEYIEYWLPDAISSVMVFASEAYRSTNDGDET